MLAAHAEQPPAGFVGAVATALGDLLAVHVPTVRWSVWPGPGGTTLGLASQARPHAPVLPFLDAQERWDARAQDWIVEYLLRAGAHLAGAAMPQQRPAPDDAAPVLPPAPRAAAVTPAPASELQPPVPEPWAQPAEPWAPPLDLTASPAEPWAPSHDEPELLLPQRASVTGYAPAVVEAPPEQPAPSPAPATAEPYRGPAAVAPLPFVPDGPLQDFALDTLNHATNVLRETGAFDHEVFVVLLDVTGRRAESCAGGAAQARSRALEIVRSSGAGRAAITWIDRNPTDLPGPRQKFAAVLVDAWDAGGEGVRVGCRFVDDVLGTGPLGRPLVVGPVARLL
jgi:hypothetical protein